MSQTFARPQAAPASAADLSTLIAQMVAESRALAAPVSALPTFTVKPPIMPSASGKTRAEIALADAMTVISEANQLLTNQQARIQQLESLLMQDEMTGLLNRRGIEAQFVREQSRVRRRQSRGCTLVVFDLDKFKQINDTFGHPAGDAALKTVGDFFLRTIRTTDAIARIGGDEFALLLTDIYPDVANRRATAISTSINHLSFIWRGGAHINISSSWGAARGMPDDPFETLYHQADVALYATKISRRS